MNKVVSLRGDAADIAQGVAAPSVVACIEEALEQAKCGEIVAIAIIKVRPNGEVGTRSVNSDGKRHVLVAGCAYMMSDMIKAGED